MAKECCRDCRFCRKLKELVNGTWVIRSCCTIWAETEPDGGYDSFVLVINDAYDRCECFSPREEATKKLVTGDIKDVIAELESKRSTRYSIVCSSIVRKTLEDAIPKSFDNVLIIDTPLLNGTDSIYIFDGDITEPRAWLPKEGLTPFD